MILMLHHLEKTLFGTSILKSTVCCLYVFKVLWEMRISHDLKTVVNCPCWGPQKGNYEKHIKHNEKIML